MRYGSGKGIVVYVGSCVRVFVTMWSAKGHDGPRRRNVRSGPAPRRAEGAGRCAAAAGGRPAAAPPAAPPPCRAAPPPRASPAPPASPAAPGPAGRESRCVCDRRKDVANLTNTVRQPPNLLSH